MQVMIRKYWSDKRALAIAAGVLLGLSFPSFPFPFLLFPAWLLLFRLADLSATMREAAYRGYVAFVIWNVITTYWLTMATLAGGIAAILANAAVMTIPFALQHLFQKRVDSSWLIVLFQSGAWISYEFMHHHWDLAWPWLALGNAWSNVPSLVQYIAVTGHLGISFWTLASAGLAYQAIRHGNKRISYAALGVCVFFPVISLVPYATASITPGKTIEAVVVQPNFDTYQSYGGYGSIYGSQMHLLELSDSVRTDSTDLVLWPESGVRTPLASKTMGATDGRIKDQLMRSADAWDATLITGAIYFDYFQPEQAPPLARRSENGPYLYYNAALGFYPDSTFDVYRKHNLVPMVERIPFVRILDAVDIFGLVDWRDEQIYGKGHTPDQFDVNGTATPALVCYDSVFPGWVREYVRRGSGFLSIITNDGWWGDTAGHHQHFAYARLRAIEFRRWVVRSANNGISGIIDPYGGVRVKTRYWESTAFRYRVPVLDELTPYARWGDWLSWLMMLATLSGLGLVYLPLSPGRSGMMDEGMDK